MRYSVLANESRAVSVAFRSGLVYKIRYIRPLGVSPLDHHERVLKPWGFLLFKHTAPITDGGAA